jgi:hypothetical protein
MATQPQMAVHIKSCVVDAEAIVCDATIYRHACLHPGCNRATLKHSLSINDLFSSGMASATGTDKRSMSVSRMRPSDGWPWTGLRATRGRRIAANIAKLPNLLKRPQY